VTWWAFLEGYGDKTGAAKAARSELMEIFKTGMQLGYANRQHAIPNPPD